MYRLEPTLTGTECLSEGYSFQCRVSIPRITGDVRKPRSDACLTSLLKIFVFFIEDLLALDLFLYGLAQKQNTAEITCMMFENGI